MDAKNKKLVFCEFQFWKKFVAMNTDGNLSVYDENKLDAELVWISVLKLIRGKAILCLNEKEKSLYNELIAAGDKHTKRLHKLKTDGGSIKFIPDFPSIKEIADNQLCAIFLFDDAPMIIQQANNKGLFIITPSTLGKMSNVNRDSGSSVRKNESFNWGELNKNHETYNSILIIDKFIENNPNQNLFPILNTLLPKELSVPFHLTICVKEQHSPIQNLYKSTLAWLSQYRAKIEIELTICLATEIHDRVIITNKHWIKSGAGFDLLSPNGISQNSTDINIAYPFIQCFSDVVDGSYISAIDDASRCIRTNIKEGSGINRMLF